MVDVSAKGLRCRAVREILDHRGVVFPSSEGTVMYELGRERDNLIHVYWDEGFATLVEPDTVVLIDNDITWQ